LVLIAASVFFGLNLENANYFGAFLVLIASCFSFLGLGLLAAVLPLLSAEKGSQATHILEGMLLLISGIYYPISALPSWLQPLSVFFSRYLYARRSKKGIVRWY
jgi:ABC-2 type transport system permease protein